MLYCFYIKNYFILFYFINIIMYAKFNKRTFLLPALLFQLFFLIVLFHNYYENSFPIEEWVLKSNPLQIKHISDTDYNTHTKTLTHTASFIILDFSLPFKLLSKRGVRHHTAHRSWNLFQDFLLNILPLSQGPDCGEKGTEREVRR